MILNISKIIIDSKVHSVFFRQETKVLFSVFFNYFYETLCQKLRQNSSFYCVEQRHPGS